MDENLSLFNLKELIKTMEETAGAHYTNWGVCLVDNEACFGLEDGQNAKLVVPLLTIVNRANRKLSGYGHDEIYVIFKMNYDNELEWLLGVKQ